MDIQGIFKKEHIIGLDIGSSSIKFAQFVEKAGGMHLIRAELKEINPSIEESVRERDMLSALAYLFRGVNLKRSKIIASVNCPQTAIRRITTPSMPKSELRQGIMLEAKNYFPFAMDESILDFEVLEEIENKGVRQYELLLNVCPRKTVEKYISILAKAKIKPYSVVGSSYTLERSAWHLQPYAKPDKVKEARCLIDIGESHTELVIGSGRMLMFARKIPVTGADFTRALTGTLGSERGNIQLSLEEAEKIKREVGIPPGSESKIIDNKISTNQIASMLMAPLDQLTNEIERCLGYYREASSGGKVSSIVLFGGGSSLKGLTRYLSDSLDMNVVVGNSFESLVVDKSAINDKADISNRLELAISAALSEARGVNLLPDEIKNEKVILVKRGLVEAVAAGLVLTLLFIYMGMNMQYSNFKKRTSAAKLELSGLTPQLRQAEAALLTNKILADEPRWKDVFTELSNLLPDSIYLTNVSMNNNIITMRGVVSSEDGENVISEFIIALEKGIFNGVKLVGSNVNPERHGELQFELKCWIDYENS